jgi:hypothetical protein
MLAGGATAAAGRLFPSWMGSRDPVLVGTGVNLAVLVLAFLLARAKRRPAVSFPP